LRKRAAAVADRQTNDIVLWSGFARGGLFAAREEPDPLIADVHLLEEAASV
jgi:hypothetical protein